MNYSPLEDLGSLSNSQSAVASQPRKHGGGRPRSAHSVLDFSERWGISEKSARRLIGRNLSDDAMAVLVAESKRYRAAQLHQVSPHGKYSGGMKALGMISRVPGVVSDEYSHSRLPTSASHSNRICDELPSLGERIFPQVEYYAKYPQGRDSGGWSSPAM